MKPRTSIALIAAVASNGVIGRNNGLPWHLPEDLAYFRQTTSSCPVIMGRLTWDSLPDRFRPLPGRRNLVITSQPGWSSSGAEAFPSIEAAIAAVEGVLRAFVIGGSRLYAAALPLADELFLTEIDREYEGDTHFPPFNRSEFVHVRREERAAQADPVLRFAFSLYRRKLDPRAAETLNLTMTDAQARETGLQYVDSGLLHEIRADLRGRVLLGSRAALDELARLIDQDFDREYGLETTPVPTRQAMA